jgi:hypothetical protein
MKAPSEETDLIAEVEYLRARVAELEDQILAMERWGSETVATAQEGLYWLERWHVDLNSLMRRRGADELRRAVRAARNIYRVGRGAKRRLFES